MTNIANLNQRITFLKNETTVDEYANHINTWAEYYSCYAYVSDNSQSETASNGTTEENKILTFSVRYCSELKDLASTKARILFNGYYYNIVGIDTLNYKNETLKIKAKRLVKRDE